MNLAKSKKNMQTFSILKTKSTYTIVIAFALLWLGLSDCYGQSEGIQDSIGVIVSDSDPQNEIEYTSITMNGDVLTFTDSEGNVTSMILSYDTLSVTYSDSAFWTFNETILPEDAVGFDLDKFSLGDCTWFSKEADTAHIFGCHRTNFGTVEIEELTNDLPSNFDDIYQIQYELIGSQIHIEFTDLEGNKFWLAWWWNGEELLIMNP